MPGADDRQSARRVTAVLVAEYDLDPAPSGAGDGSAMGQALQLLRAGGGDAEPLRPGALVAVFDRVAGAVTGAIQLTRGGADAEPGPQWRAGLHVGKILMTGEGTALLEAIDRATALAQVARRGTTAVAADALATFDHPDDADLVPLETVDPSRMHEGGVYLIVPRLSAPVLARRRMLVLLAGSAALGGAATGAWVLAHHVSGGGELQHVTLGVGPFRLSGSDQTRAWIGPAMRDGLNTELSELSGVRLYSDEFIDFLMSRQGLTAMEVATRLGIEKMVNGTVVTVGDAVRVEVRIVDVGTGLFEDAYVASGREEDFLSLERDVVLGIIAKLHLQLTEEDERRFAAYRATDLDALRRVLRVEGETPVAPSPESVPPADPHSWLRDLLGPRVAQAEENDAGVATFLEAFRRATEARDVAGLAEMYVVFSPEQRAALEEYFAGVRDLRMGIARVDVAVVGEEAVVSYTRTDDFVDVSSNRALHVSVRVTKMLRRGGGHWRFVQ